MAEAQKIQIQCPNCGTPYQAPVLSIIDVGQFPELRRAFLSGQINVAQCPNCQQTALLEVPMLYHDAAAEFLAVYFPSQLNVPEMERQRVIGEMTQALMKTLPPEQRKGYFFSPRQFINRQTLMDAVLGTMGISQEQLDRQRKKAKLLDQAMVMVDDSKGLAMLIKAQEAQFDYEFFMILNNAVEQSAAVGDEKGAEGLLKLRERLMETTTFGKRIAKQEQAVAGLRELKSPEELVQRVVEADLDTLEAMVLAARPLMDYQFFQQLSERIEAARGPEKDRLTMIRERLLKAVDQVDEVARESLQGATGLLNELLKTPEVRSAVREHAEEIDNVFMSVLSANMQEAERRGAKDALTRLEIIWDEIMAMVEESMPPEIQLVNELLRLPYPERTREVLKERRAEITPDLLAVMDELALDLSERNDLETAKRVRDIKAQATLLA